MALKGRFRLVILQILSLLLLLASALPSPADGKSPATGTSKASSKPAASSGKKSPFIPRPFIRLGTAHQDYALLVDKSAQLLFLYTAANEGTGLLKVYPASTGRKHGDKMRRGDLRTPEGVYYFNSVLNDHQLEDKYGVRAFVTDYPNFLDRRRGKGGYGIWLHATDNPQRDLNGNDTQGCVVVSNENILDISSYITLKDTPIIIVDEVQYVPSNQVQREDREIRAMLERWEKDWEGMHLKAYMTHYSKNFKARDMDKDGWREYKEDLNKERRFIKVKLTNLKLLRHNGVVVASFRQHYTSDKHTDVGLKKLFLKHEDGGWKILTEEWTEITQADLRAQRRLLRQARR